MSSMASHVTSLTIVYSTVYSGADQRKHQSFTSLAFLMGIHRWPVNSPHKGPVTRKMFPFDDVIMKITTQHYHNNLKDCRGTTNCLGMHLLSSKSWHQGHKLSHAMCYHTNMPAFSISFQKKLLASTLKCSTANEIFNKTYSAHRPHTYS